MTGPEHYQTAETLLGNLRRDMAGRPGVLLHTPEQQSRMIAEAQAHATLALTAAMQPGAMDADKQRAWREVTA